MRGHLHAVFALCAAMVLEGCANGPAPSRLQALAHLGSGPTYDIGPIQVTLTSPGGVAHECGVPCEGGCLKRNFFATDSPEYARGLRHHLIAVPDVYVLLHELKHALEPGWTHPGDLRLECDPR
jgi:hypothetical protein